MAIINGIPNGLKYYATKLESGSSASSNIDRFIQDSINNKTLDSIVNFTVAPNDLFDWGAISEERYDPLYKDYSFNRPTNIGGYVPQNNKLFTYPYSYLVVDTCDTQKEYRYEKFNFSNTITFSLLLTPGSVVEVDCYPNNYDGITGKNGTESISMSNFPQCAINVDSYKVWVANGGNIDTLLNTVAGVAGTAGNAAVGNVGGVIGGVVSLVNTGKQAYYDTKGASVKGNQTGNNDVAGKLKNFYFKDTGVNAEYAKLIDEYFTAYGYASGAVKVPNRNVRKRFTYTKTHECVLKNCNLPAEAEQKIKSIYNNGIRFWRSGYTIGDNLNSDNGIG